MARNTQKDGAFTSKMELKLKSYNRISGGSSVKTLNIAPRQGESLVNFVKSKIKIMASGENIVYCFWTVEYKSISETGADNKNDQSHDPVKIESPKTFILGKVQSLEYLANHQYSWKPDTKRIFRKFIEEKLDFSVQCRASARGRKDRVLFIQSSLDRSAIFELMGPDDVFCKVDCL